MPRSVRPIPPAEALVEELYRDHADWLVRRLGARVGRDAAEEAVQDLWIRVMRQPAASPIRNPKAFLLTIASRLALDEGRRRDRRLALPAVSPDTAADQAEGVLLKQVILTMPEPLRDVFVLARFAGLSSAEIADRLGLRPKTVEWRMTKALAHCAAQLRR